MFIPKKCLSINDAAKKLGLGRSTIWRWMNQGKIKFIKRASHTFIPQSEVEFLMCVNKFEKQINDAEKTRLELADFIRNETGG